MKKFLLLLLTLITLNVSAQEWKPQLKKIFKFSTFYGAVNGGTSLSNVDVYSVTDGLQTTTIETPFDYSVTLGIRKIARFGYENRANTFYNGTENTFSDAATIGKVKGFEFLFEGEYKKHHDVFWINNDQFHRKLSCVVQLTDPNEYEGGDFEMFDLTEYPNAQEVRAQGSTIFFPSFVPHQAHPVTKGKRYSLAVWFEGPKWV